MSKLKMSVFAAIAASAVSTAMAHSVKCGDLDVVHPYTVPSIAGTKNGAGYFIAIKNNGKEADQLIGASTTASKSVELHEMTMDGNVMKMRQVPEVQMPAGYEVTFRHGEANGYHLMLIDLKNPLKEGDKFPVTLNFKRAGKCEAEVWVEAPKKNDHKH
jgi:copper(I)-binding protein